ncbi:MAG: hypothetical protein U9O78_01685, partial [Patescibacteria group bacterium]|nr:hypothetical protein [Patescibacteria group bacterium]
MKLISVNIEGDKHLDKVLPFLKKEQANVICLQEIYEHQQKNFEKELKMNSFFVKTCQDFSKTDTFIGNKGNLIATNCK